MPTQNLSDKKLTAIITAGMNNTPSSEALMKYSKNYRKDDENRIYRQLPDNSSDIHLSAASSFSGGMSPSGGATPVYRSSSVSNMKSEIELPRHVISRMFKMCCNREINSALLTAGRVPLANK